MKKLISTVLCLLILLSCILPAMAATGVPEEVMESTKSVVRILSKYYNGAATGSGFVIKNEPGEVLIATNDHVVEGNPTSISIWVGEDRMVDAEIVFTTSQKDLCVLKVTDKINMKPLTLSREEPQHGAAIYVVGYPGAGDILSDTQAHTSESVTITDGIISAIRSFTIEKGGKPVKLLQVNAAINSGNSGGPLFNTKGEVIGINTYKVNADSQGVFGSVAVSELLALLDKHNIEIPVVTSSPSNSVAVIIGAVAVLLVVILLISVKKKKAHKKTAKRSRTKEKSVTLTTYMQQYPQGLGVNGAVSLLLGAAIQLRNLHNDGKLHLQICPDNILISANGVSFKDPSNQETSRYNSGFAAPEVYKGAGFGITSDIYSFAAVLLYAVTGQVPTNSLQLELVEQQIDTITESAFTGVLCRAMAFGILERTQSMQELISGIAVYNTAAQEMKPVRELPKPKAITQEEPKPTAVSIKEKQKKQPKQCKQKTHNKRTTKVLPVAAVLTCVIAVVVFFGKPLTKGKVNIQLNSSEQTEVIELTEEEIAYAEAEQLLSDGETARATIAFGKLGDYKDARQRSYTLWDQVAVRDIIAVQGGNFWGTTHAVKEDGTAVFAGGLGGTDTKKQLSKDIRANGLDWNDLIAVSNDLTGLKADGTVVKKYHPSWFKRSRTFSEWKDIVAIDGFLGLRMDGTVVEDSGYLEDSTREEISQWKDIIAICGSGRPYFGLTVDGTIVMAGDWGEWQYDISQWQDIIAIRSGDGFLVGLRADGTVVATGQNGDRQCDVSQWTDVIAIAAGNCHTVGLKSDGTVLTTGSNRDGACNVEKWTDIIAVFAGGFHTVGLKSDGTVVAAGNNTYGQCNVREWSGISLPGQLVSKPKEAPTDQQAEYDAAEKLLANGETAKAAIAFAKLGDYSDARNRSFVLWDEIAVRDTICAMGGLNELGTAGLMSDGTVLLTGGASSKLPHRKQHWESMSNDVDTWTNIIAIASGSSLFGLKADGSVNVAAPNGLWSEVEQWQDIVSISASDYFVLGLKMDGTVQVDSWKSSNDEENDRLAWIPELSKWTDIVAVSAGTYNAVGLRANGTVVVLGEPNREKYWREIEQWQNIITISTGPYGDTLGLKADGTLLSAGGYIANGDWDVSQWHNIVDFSVGYHQVLGVRSDGTVVADGYNHNGCISVKNWTDIIAVDTDGNSFGWHTVGLKSDGTVVAVGENTYGQCNVQSWTDIVLPGQLTAKPKDMPPADQQTQYDAAEKLLADGETAKAAIAFGKLGDYKDAHDRSFACWRSLNRYDTIDATSDCTVGIQSDGSVITAGEEFGHWYKTKEWSVVDLAAKGTNILGLQTDGTVVSEGWNDYGQMEVDTWTDIVDISASRTHSVGLKTNGKVVTAGMNRLGQCDVDNWNNIVSVSAGYSCTIGLKKDGTVIFTGDNSSGQCDFENWFDIVSVCANTYSNGRDLYVVGITSNGSVLATGNNDSGQCDISGWEDIISVSAGYKHTVGLKADGTVVAVGRNDFGQCNVDSWTDIVAVSAGGNNTVGLKSDGTVVAVGDNSRGQCNVSNWTDLKLPN